MSSTEPAQSDSPTPAPTQLRRLLIQHFDLEELRDLCFDLEVDYDSLRGDDKRVKTRELVAYMERMKRLLRQRLFCVLALRRGAGACISILGNIKYAALAQE